MSWELLPTDITIYILKLRSSLRNDACLKIQSSWFKHILPDMTAIDISLNIHLDEDYEFIIDTPESVSIINKCLFIATGKRHLLFWNKYLNKIKKSLIINEYMGGPSSIYYNQTEELYYKLTEKFQLMEIDLNSEF